MDNQKDFLTEALQNQVEALQSRIEAYKLQNEALNLHNEALQIKLEDCKNHLEECRNNLGDCKNSLEDCRNNLEDCKKHIEDLNYKINKTEEDRKMLTAKDKVFNYLLSKINTVFPNRKTQTITYRYVVRLAEYMLEKEIVTGDEIKSRFGISRNTQWRYLQYIRPLGYFKYSRPYGKSTFTITEHGKTAKEDIKHL